MKVATWNVNSLRVRLVQVLEWLALQKVDVLALQETKVMDKDFPATAFTTQGYHVLFTGEKSYNGVALVSTQPLSDPDYGLLDNFDLQRRLLSATVNGVRIVNVYVPNGSSVGSEKYQYKLRWLSGLVDYVHLQLTKYEKVMILGDFNIAPSNDDVHDPELWRDQVLCSGPEREALQRLMQIGLQDAFRLFPQPANSYSWWDYRLAAFRRNLGLRIDHILVNANLARTCQACGIDKLPRSWPQPSDHTPVWASFIE